MSVIDRGFHRNGHFGDWLKNFLRRRMRETIGVALILAACTSAAALATWSIHDPSLSHATAARARNLLGVPGAMLSDLLMQLFGLAAIAFVLVPAIWGWRLLNHRAFDREWLRAIVWFAAIVIASAACACLPRLSGWPLPTGLGGAVGDGLLRLPLLFADETSALTFLLLGLTLGVAAFAGLSWAAGWRARGRDEDAHPLPDHDEADTTPTEDDDADDESRGISIGRFVHLAYSARAQLHRLFANLWRAARSPAADVSARDRLEPRLRGEPVFGGPATPDDNGRYAAPDAEADEYEGEIEEAPRAPRRRRAPAVKPAKKGAAFQLPAVNLLSTPRYTERAALSADILAENSKTLESVLQDFGVRGEIITAHPGPVVTLYELEPAPGIKSSRVIGLADDIARSMSAVSARVAVVPGRNAIGIELPNPTREKVFLRELLADESTQAGVKLPLCLGKTIGGDPVITDLARMPHLLIAGTTGSGKSVAINTMILSLVYRLRPDQCRLIMVDPKMLELSVYDGIPHLLAPVVTDPKKAVVALKWAVREMEDRYKKMSKLGVRNIDGYNARVVESASRGEALTRTVHTGYDKETGKAIYEEEKLDLEPLPYIVVIVDEMADLMMVAGKDIEGAIQRLAQMARAAGIHVILATQRPSVDVITGTIKANFPTRISFQVTSKIDSRTILGEQGAEQLLGQGDMLYMAGGGRISRVHGPFVSDDEVEKVVRHLKAQGVPQYLEAVTAEDEPEEGEDGAVFDATGMGASGDATDLYQQAVQIVLRDRKASTSYIQRRLQIGYNRAASIMERMEHEGVVGQANHAGKREILLGQEEHESI